MRHFSFVLAFASLLAACTSEDVMNVNNGAPINFRAGTDFSMTQSRGVMISTDGLSSFYVTAFNKDDKALFENQLFVFDNVLNGFASSMKYYFPSDGSDVKFHAYYPSLDELNATIANRKLVDYSPAENIKDQQDFITATASANKTTGASGVQLNFAHELSTVSFMAKNENEGYVVKVCGVRLGQVASKGTFDFVTSKWTLDDQKSNYEVITDPITLNNVGQEIFNQDYGFMLPQSFGNNHWDPANDPENNNKGAYVAFKINVKTNAGAPIFPKTGDTFEWVAVPMPSDATWTSGNYYCYQIDFTESLGYISPEDGDDAGDEGEKIKYGDGAIHFKAEVAKWAVKNIDLP